MTCAAEECLRFVGKVSDLLSDSNGYLTFLTNFALEAEEEAGSAEEQPASNRLLRHTEIVFSGRGR